MSKRALALKRYASESNGFTLIELLIAISIVAVISAVGLVSFSTSQEKARDARRKQDLRSIKTALELYKFKSPTKSYSTTEGVCCSDGALLSSSSEPWIPALSKDYINFVPVDPLKNEGNPILSEEDILGYSYWAGQISGGKCPGGVGQYFILAAGLENKYDPDANLNMQYKRCDITSENITDNENVYILTSN